MLRKIIGEIVCAFAPVDQEMALAHPVADPVKTHIHGFGATLFDGVVCDTGGAGIVGLDGGCRLWMSHVAEGVAEHGGLFSIEEEGTKFGLGGRGEDGGHDGGVDVDGAVVGRGSVVGKRCFVRCRELVAEEEDAAGA